MWTIDEVDDKLIGLNKKSARPSTNTRALPIIISNGSSCPIAARRCLAILHLPPGYYQSSSKVPVIVAVSGMDGFKERSVALYNDTWMQRGYAVLAFEGPGYWEPPLRGIFVDVLGWAEAAKTLADWLVKRPEIDAGKIGMTGVSYGSFFTVIMMAADARYKACAVTGTCYEPCTWRHICRPIAMPRPAPTRR